MSDKRNKLHLPDILFGKRKDDPDLDPDDMVEVYGPAEMLGAIGGTEEPDPEDLNNVIYEDDDMSAYEPAPLYGPLGF